MLITLRSSTYHLITIWWFSIDFWSSLKVNQKIISRSSHDHLKRIVCSFMIIVCWISLDQAPPFSCSFYDYCLLNIFKSSVYYPMIIWWLTDDYSLITWLLLKDRRIIIWWLSDYHLKIVWWSFEEQLMNIWRSSVDHLKVIICLFEESSWVEYLLIICWLWWLSDYYLIIILWTSEYHLNIIWISLKHHKMIIWWPSDYNLKNIWWSSEDDRLLNIVVNYPMIIWWL